MSAARSLTPAQWWRVRERLRRSAGGSGALEQAIDDTMKDLERVRFCLEVAGIDDGMRQDVADMLEELRTMRRIL